MDISLKCNISLSKKLRAILGDSEGKVVLVTDPIRDGRGTGTIMISGDNLNLNVANQIIGKETSIQFIPSSIKDEVPSETTVTNLFSTAVTPQGPRTVVDRMAATVPPEKNQVAHAIKQPEEIITPEAFPEYKAPEFQSFVSDFSELMMAIQAAQGKESDIDLDSIDDPRQKALAMEMKEQAEAIDIPAFIVNNTCGSVRLNDIDISLVLNTPINLANISAKRLASSGDLKSMLRSKIIKFISPDEVDAYRSKAIEGVALPGLETYDIKGAEAAIANDTRIPDAEQVDIPVDDTGPSDQERLAGLINLTPNSGGESGGSRTSFHGETQARAKQTVSGTSTANPQGIKTISKL